MAFSGDFTPMFHKHTRSLELKDAISIAVDRIHRGFEPLKAQVEAMHEQGLTDEKVKLIIYQAFLDRRIRGVPRHLLPIVHDLYFKPQHESFVPRNLWSLSNAFTSSFKKLAPVKQFEVTARLGSYLSEIQDGLKFERELRLDLAPTEDAKKGFLEDHFDEDDIAEDPYEEFDEYHDSEEEEELIEEYERRIAA